MSNGIHDVSILWNHQDFVVSSLRQINTDDFHFCGVNRHVIHLNIFYYALLIDYRRVN